MNKKYRIDMFAGKPDHPQCVFFEAFQSTPDPDEEFYGAWFCHMSGSPEHAEICKGDYCECPIAYGKSNISPRNSNNDATS